MTTAATLLTTVTAMATAPPAAAADPVFAPVTFEHTGAPQLYTVPTTVSLVQVKAWGAQGGGWGGEGGYSTASVSVVPGSLLHVYVGGQGSPGTATEGGAGGFNGGGPGGSVLFPYSYSTTAGAGGGGASDVRTGAGTLADRVVVAGGGGGTGGSGMHCSGAWGGDGGGAYGYSGGGNCSTGNGGGAGADMLFPGLTPFLGVGSLGQGGVGGTQTGSSLSSGGGGGGGGGGWFGGAGGSQGTASNSCCVNPNGAGGGGGSGWIPLTDPYASTYNGYQYGDGLVEITPIWSPIVAPTIIVNPARTATVGQPTTVRALVLDSGGKPLPGQVVSWSVSGTHTRTASSVSGADGYASLTYTGTSTGADAVRASISDDAVGVGTVAWVEQFVYAHTGAMSVEGDVVRSGTPATFVTMSQENWTTTTRPYQGIVRFSIAAQDNLASASLSPTAVTASSIGRADATFLATVANVDHPGSAIVQAYPDRNNNGVRDAATEVAKTIAVGVQPPPPETSRFAYVSSSASPIPLQARSGEARALTNVTREQWTIGSRRYDGVVRYSILSSAGLSTATATPATATTGANDITTAAFTATLENPDREGTAVVQVHPDRDGDLFVDPDELAGRVTLVVEPVAEPPAAIVFESATTQQVTGQPATVRARVLDRIGRPVAGRVVTWGVTGANRARRRPRRPMATATRR